MVRALLFAVLLAAVPLGGCFGAEEDPPPPAKNTTKPPTNTTNRTPTNNTTNPPPPPPTFKGSNGTETVEGGVQATGTITIDVAVGASTLDVTFAARGSLSGGLGGGAVAQFQATLLDPSGESAGTSTAVTTGLSAASPVPGAWTVQVSFSSAPTESVDVAWEVA